MTWKITALTCVLISLAVISGFSGEAASRGGATLSTSTTRGKTPLHVTFSGNGGGATYFGGLHIDFGDGTSQNACLPGQSCTSIRASHTYAHPGSYVAKLRGVGEGQTTALARVTIRAR